MAFEALEKTPEVAPLLVRLYDTHNIYNLAGERDNEESRTELTAIMLDLLKIKLTNREQELISDVILSLMKQAQKDLRMGMAEKIATMENVPLRMVLGIANDDIEIADPVLRYSPIFQDLDLAYILQSKGVEHGRSIAMRDELSDTMIDMLVDTKDFQIAINLCENDGIKLTEHAFKIYTDIAKSNETLARPLVSRKDIPKLYVAKIYEFVGEEIKKSIKQKYGIEMFEVAKKAVDDVSTEIVREHDHIKESGSLDPLIQHAKGLSIVGELKPALMVANLRRGQNSSFLAQFTVFFKLPVAQAKKILADKSGMSLAKVCIALELPKNEFVSLYLLTEKFRSDVKKVANHNELSRIMNMYDGISVSVAKEYLKNCRH